MSRHPHRPFLWLVLALALIAAQLGAAAHAYSHLRTGPDSSNDPARQPQMCTACLAFAAVSSAAGNSDSPVVVLPPDADVAACVVVDSLIEQFHQHAFRSRAPPHLL